jgi:hypothetical protein
MRCGDALRWKIYPFVEVKVSLLLAGLFFAQSDKTKESRKLAVIAGSPGSVTQSPGTYSIGLMRCGDALRWKIEASEMEAILLPNQRSNPSSTRSFARGCEPFVE